MKNTYRILWNSPKLAGLLIIVATIAILLSAWLGGYLEAPELKAYDHLLRLGPTISSNKKIALITVSENDIQRLGRWPMDDETLAKVLEEIEVQQHPRVIGLDLYRDVPVPPGHETLNATLLRFPNIIATYKSGDIHQQGVRPPAILRWTSRVGFNDIIVDPDGVTRRALLFVQEGKEMVQSFALMLALQFLEKEGITSLPDPIEPSYLKLGNNTIPPLSSNGGGYRGADTAGYQFLLDYRDTHGSFIAYSLNDLLSGRIPPLTLHNQIVLIGTVAPSVKDFFYTPTEPTNKPFGKTPGVSMHANIASQLIRMAIDSDRPIKTIEEFAEALWMTAWIIAGTILGYHASTLSRFPIVWMMGVAIIIGVAASALHESWWIPIILPTLGWSISFVLMNAYVAIREKLQRADTMRLFEQFVAPEIAQAIWKQRDQLLQGLHPKPRKTIATLLFSDLLGFTTIAEKLEPEITISWLEDYLIVMAECVHAHGGIIIRFVGDAIMAVFGVQLTHDSQYDVAEAAKNAAKCALAMDQALLELNRKWQVRNLPVTGMRIGINTGLVVAGCLGAHERLEYTVHGDAVNIAARLEQLRKDEFQPDCFLQPSRILIGEATADILDDRFVVNPVGSYRLSGKDQEISVYQLLGVDGKPPD